ncbi:unnamed protein product [Dovyalis caffra]|uniref:beta-ketoacyl-[acyl-carrier-protein] synthase I n=1 Tax=Dovyalis caffra TaxID=77055 RepID=A0AAV1SUH2_9ROSI|nr:unnamed protein product [Dovyalis caffra]
MAATSMSSPFCSWFLAASMSLACERDQPLRSPMSQSPKRINLRTRPKKLVSKCSNKIGGAGQHSSNSVSSFYGFVIRRSMSSFESFKTFEELHSSQRLSFGGENIFSLFGSKAAPLMNRKPRHKNGFSMAVAVQPESDVIMKKRPNKEQRRVIVTGMGVVTSIGDDVDVYYSNLLDGVSGISKIESFDCAEYPTKIAGEIKSFSPDGWVSPKLSRRADKFMLYALTAGKKALVDGGVTEQVMDELDKTKCGVVIGSSMGGLRILEMMSKTEMNVVALGQVHYEGVEALRVSYKKMNPFCIPFSTSNIGSAMLALDLGWMGPSYSISSACATSNVCIHSSANHIIKAETDLMLCGGSEATILPIGLGGLMACKALSRRNDDPTKASRPWDTDRDGFVLGEGAGVLLLEELEHAKKRGAKIYAEFLGGSFTCDAYSITESHPDGKGIALCIEKALALSGVAREDVNYINAHATSTPIGDLTEYQALVRCFGRNPELRVNSTKSMIGNLQGASGAVEAVATVKAIQTGWLHPNINLENPDKAVDMNLLIGAEKERMDIKVALSNSFGFGGHNASILFAPYKL